MEYSVECSVVGLLGYCRLSRPSSTIMDQDNNSCWNSESLGPMGRIVKAFTPSPAQLVPATSSGFNKCEGSPHLVAFLLVHSGPVLKRKMSVNKGGGETEATFQHA